MLKPDGYNGYESGAPYWILPNGSKTYDAYEAYKVHEEYFKNIKKNKFV